MNTVTLSIPRALTLDDADKRVRGWADRRPFGISSHCDEAKHCAVVTFYDDSSKAQRDKAVDDLARLLTRAAKATVAARRASLSPAPAPVKVWELMKWLDLVDGNRGVVLSVTAHGSIKTIPLTLDQFARNNDDHSIEIQIKRDTI